MITIALSSHRLEILPLVRDYMLESEIIVLEEPPHPDFPLVVSGHMDIGEYLVSTDIEYHQYASGLLTFLQKLHTRGSTIIQVEPYLETLYNIHENFARGKTISDIMSSEKMVPVYVAERKATAALVRYYEKTLQGSYDDIVDAVVNFARADADRILLRDRMRSNAIKELYLSFMGKKKTYIEAGYIHFALYKFLYRLLHRYTEVRPLYVMAKVTSATTGKKQILGPGDILTLSFVFRRRISVDRAQLLAARSLVYIMLLKKEEMTPNHSSPFPHAMDEIKALNLVSKLDKDDCRFLFREMYPGRGRKMDPEICTGFVRDYLNKKALKGKV